MRLNLQVAYTEKSDEPKDIICNPSDMVKLEERFDISIASLENNIKITHLLFLAWASESRTKATTLVFEEWVDTVDSVSPSEAQKKIVGLGDSSAHWYLATLAVETGISPRELMKLDDRMLWTMGRYLVWRATHQAPKL